MHVPHLPEIEMVQGAMAELGKVHGDGANWGETKKKNVDAHSSSVGNSVVERWAKQLKP
jgi:hypothetical protein